MQENLLVEGFLKLVSVHLDLAVDTLMYLLISTCQPLILTVSDNILSFSQTIFHIHHFLVCVYYRDYTF